LERNIATLQPRGPGRKKRDGGGRELRCGAMMPGRLLTAATRLDAHNTGMTQVLASRLLRDGITTTCRGTCATSANDKLTRAACESVLSRQRT
jgi:hypothetical protein